MRMIASPLPSPPRKSPSRAISRARTASPATAPAAPGRAPARGARSSGPGSPRRARRTAPRPGHRPGPARSVSVAVGVALVEDVGGDHAEQREAARHVEADEAAAGAQLPAQKPILARPAPPASRTALPFASAASRSSAWKSTIRSCSAGSVGGQDAYGEQAGVAGVADGDRGDRHAGGHLHDREQRVHAVEVLQRDGYADHRQRRDRRRACRAGGPRRRRRR